MRNMAVIREKAEKFQETEEFADIINAIGEGRCAGDRR